MRNKEEWKRFSDEELMDEELDQDFAGEEYEDDEDSGGEDDGGDFDEEEYDDEIFEEESDRREYEDEEDLEEEEYEDFDGEEYEDDEDFDGEEYEDDEDFDGEEYEDDEDFDEEEFEDDEDFDEEEYEDVQDSDGEADTHEDSEGDEEFEAGINAAMSGIARDGDREGRSSNPARPAKSARPKPLTYVPMDDDELLIPEKKSRGKHKGLKITGAAALMLLVSAGCAYAGVSYYYSDKFFEGTTINGYDCSGKTPYEVEQMIAKNVENYSIQVSSRNLEPQVIEGSLIDYKYAPDGEVMKLLKDQKPYKWIRGYFEEKSYTIAENVTYSKELLQNQVLQLNCAQKENQVAPENAYVSFIDTHFEIVPETEGSELNVKQAYQILDEAVSGKQETIDFSGNSDAYVAAAVTSEDPGLKATLDACNNFTKASITYTFGEETVTLDGTTIKDWLQFDEKGQFVQDDASFQQHIAEYVAQLAAQYDTVGTSREFYTTSGRTVYVYGSAYGWQIDQKAEAAQLTQDIQSGAQTTRDPVYAMTANSRGYNDLGNTYIEVDLSNQHMYYYQDGGIIFDSDIVSGNMSYSDRQTPEGIYTLYYKKSPDVLRGEKKPDGTYEYETEVEYWMPFNGGIGFHDASWQPYFGGDRYLTGGSHGCINMPPYNAAILYEIIQYGVPIVCFY